jgi:hypothetical protein
MLYYFANQSINCKHLNCIDTSSILTVPDQSIALEPLLRDGYKFQIRSAILLLTAEESRPRDFPGGCEGRRIPCSRHQPAPFILDPPCPTNGGCLVTMIDQIEFSSNFSATATN